MKVIRNHFSKLIKWVAEQELLSHQVWSSSNKKYWKNKVFNFDLDLKLDIYYLVGYLLTPWYSYMPTMMFLRWKKEVEKIQFLRYDVTKWRHNIKIFVDLESPYQVLSYEVLHDMVPYGTFDFKIWPSGKQISTRSETHEGHGWSAPKINQLRGSSYATFTPSLELIW
jgi:hypothetical protein